MDESGNSATAPRGLVPWKPGQSGNPLGRPKGIKRLRQLLGASIDDYAMALHNLAMTPGKQQTEALKLAFAYLVGPPNALTPAEESELASLTTDELKERVQKALRAA
jgi:hypothetical protein